MPGRDTNVGSISGGVTDAGWISGRHTNAGSIATDAGWIAGRDTNAGSISGGATDTGWMAGQIREERDGFWTGHKFKKQMESAVEIVKIPKRKVTVLGILPTWVLPGIGGGFAQR